MLGALALFAVLIGAWEAYWRAYGVVPGVRNGLGLWAIQRRRIDAGEGNATVLLGSSRLYFDVQLPVWERLAGTAPIQLSYEGTSPLTAVEDLAADPKFTGRLIVGVAPDLFFTGGGRGDGAAAYARKESPAQRVGQWLSMHLVEPYLAFDDPDFSLATVLKRQDWPKRPGRYWFMDVRKLAIEEPARNAYLWAKVSDDLQYRELARSIWREGFGSYPGDPTPEEELKTAREQIERMVKAMVQLRAHGVQVLFARLPVDGPYLAYENTAFSAGADLGRTAGGHARTGNPLPGLSADAGLLPARVVAHDPRRGRALHRGVLPDHRGEFLARRRARRGAAGERAQPLSAAGCFTRGSSPSRAACG